MSDATLRGAEDSAPVECPVCDACEGSGNCQECDGTGRSGLDHAAALALAWEEVTDHPEGQVVS